MHTSWQLHNNLLNPLKKISVWNLGWSLTKETPWYQIMSVLRAAPPNVGHVVRGKVRVFFFFLKGCMSSCSTDKAWMDGLVCISLQQKEMLFHRKRCSKTSLPGGWCVLPRDSPAWGVIQQWLGNQDWSCCQGHLSFEWTLRLLPNLSCHGAVILVWTGNFKSSLVSTWSLINFNWAYWLTAKPSVFVCHLLIHLEKKNTSSRAINSLMKNQPNTARSRPDADFW